MDEVIGTLVTSAAGDGFALVAFGACTLRLPSVRASCPQVFMSTFAGELVMLDAVWAFFCNDTYMARPALQGKDFCTDEG